MTIELELISSGALAKRLDVSRQRVNQWATAGRIPVAARYGKLRFFAPDTQRPELRKPGRKPGK